LAAANASRLTGLRHSLVRMWHGLSLAYKANGALTAAVQAAEAAVVAACDETQLAPRSSTRATPSALSPVLLARRPQLERRVPPSVLFHLAECYSTLGAYEDASTCLRAALGVSGDGASGNPSDAPRRGDDVAGWYALACCHRSLARRCIGDGVLGRGLAHVADGLAAAFAAIRLVLLVDEDGGGTLDCDEIASALANLGRDAVRVHTGSTQLLLLAAHGRERRVAAQQQQQRCQASAANTRKRAAVAAGTGGLRCARSRSSCCWASWQMESSSRTSNSTSALSAGE